tara:strand:- start:983 stop:1126 length:144 start_codon:yes stop_codon:yes gene_type:complete
MLTMNFLTLYEFPAEISLSPSLLSREKFSGVIHGRLSRIARFIIFFK